MKKRILSLIPEFLLMVCNRIIFISLSLLLLGSIFSKSADAGSFDAVLGGDGIVTLSGSQGFECIPEGYDFASLAIVNLYCGGPTCRYDGVGTVYSGSEFVSFDGMEYNISCMLPGDYIFRVSFSGGKWREDSYTHEMVCRMEGMGGTGYYTAEVNLPEGRNTDSI